MNKTVTHPIPVMMTVIEYNRDGNRIYSIEAISLGIEKEKSAGQLVAQDERKSPEQTPIADFYTRIEKLLNKYNHSSKIVGCVRALNKTVTHPQRKLAYLSILPPL